MAALYDTIGKAYADYRRPDPRIAAAICKALGEAKINGILVQARRN